MTDGDVERSVHEVFGSCLSYLPIAVIKHHKQGNLDKELAYSSRKMGVHPDGNHSIKNLAGAGC